MQKSIKIRFFASAFIVLLSVYMLLPSIWSITHPENPEQMPKWLPNAAMRLGLDLQGGIHMVMGVDLDGVVDAQLKVYGNSLERSLEKDGVKFKGSRVIKERNELEIQLASPTDADKISSKLSTEMNVLEFVGEQNELVVLRLKRDQELDVRNRAISQSIETIRNRIDEFGVSEPVISRKGDDQILVQFPGAREPERLKSLIGQTAKLSFQILPESNDDAAYAKIETELVQWISDAEKAGNYTRETFPRLSEYRDRLVADIGAKLPKDTELAFERMNNPNVVDQIQLKPFLLSTKDVLSGEYIENAFVGMDSGRSGVGPQRPVVSFSMDPVGAPLLSELTSQFRGYRMAIVLDGIIKSSPNIQSAITGGSGQITLGTGNFEQISKEAHDLTIVLRAGALPANIEVLEERVIGPSMGRDALEAGKTSLVLASIMVFIFLCSYYGYMGFLGTFSTLANICITFALLGMMNATLTLPGIAGVVLTIGMAVDALVIIFERMREELRAGRSPQQVIEMGFDNAFSAILDSNVTTAIGAFILLEFGTGTVRGFALTLLVGILGNIITATFLTKSIVKYLVRGNGKQIMVGLSKKELAYTGK
jgi:preprotein translocase subunit SecD